MSVVFVLAGASLEDPLGEIAVEIDEVLDRGNGDMPNAPMAGVSECEFPVFLGKR